MNDYPSTSPFGPHGPQIGATDPMPNPTAPYQDPTFQSQPSQSWDAGTSTPAASSGGGGYAGSGAPAGVSGPSVSIGTWMRNLAVVGGALGGIAALFRTFALHQSLAMLGIAAVRMGVAGAAVGASIPPAFRVAGSIAKAAVWAVLAVILWGIAAAALGQLNWLARLP